MSVYSEWAVGTGKTTIAVQRMWALFRAHRESGSEDLNYNQLFVTANAVLKDQVEKCFRGLQGGIENEFPMFMTATAWIRMLDSSLPNPFLPLGREEIGSGGWNNEAGCLDSLPMPGDDSSDDSDDESEADEQQPRGEPQRKEVDFLFFLTKLWPKMTKHQASQVSPSAVYTEIMSFIKGSNQSLGTEKGYLSREEYNEIPVKMAAQFESRRPDEVAEGSFDKIGSRELVYGNCLDAPLSLTLLLRCRFICKLRKLEKKARHVRYELMSPNSAHSPISSMEADSADVVFNIFSRISDEGYHGIKFHSITVDEVCAQLT